MIKYGILLMLAVISGQVLSQPASPRICGHTKMVITDTSRENRRIPVSIWYPTKGEGAITSLSDNVIRIPVIVFGHGFKLPEKSYRNIVDLLVSQGFIVAFPLTERGFHPSHQELARDLAFVMRTFRQWDQESTSMFYGHISQRNCIMGHSMGGGAAVLAASLGPEISALATLNLYNTTPSAAEAARKVKIPSLFLAGSLDCVTPPEDHQVPVYEALAADDKTFISVTGGTHCGMMSSGRLCHLAERTCRPRDVLPPPEQQIILERYLLPWLKSRLTDDQDEKIRMEKLLSADPQVTWHSATSGRGHTD